MMKKLIILIFLISLAIVPTQTFAEDDIIIEPYKGMIGPDHFLYRFKLILERVDESLTFDPIKKREKQMNYAQLRLAEAQNEISMNRIYTANKAMGLYFLQIDKINLDNIPFLNYDPYTGVPETKLTPIQQNIDEQIKIKNRIMIDNLKQSQVI